MSTSTDEDVALEFGDDTFVITINAPKETNGLYLGSNSSISYEAEMLLGRNQKYKILNSSKTTLEIKVLPWLKIDF